MKLSSASLRRLSVIISDIHYFEGRHIRLPEAVAEDVGVTRRHIENLLAFMHEEGLIIWHRKSRGKPRRPYWYVELLEGPFWAQVRCQHVSQGIQV